MPEAAVALDGVSAVVLDIEGTVGDLAHVHEVLFPYARVRLAQWFAEHRDTAEYAELCRRVRELAQRPDLDESGVVATLTAWSDADMKAPPLKTVQSLIWARGYADGALHGHVYPEVPAALRRWRDAGIARYIYSSGARAAQVDWFTHSNLGDLSPLLDGYFDLADAGPKREPDSYLAIARAVGLAPAAIVFCSDVDAELDAARTAGWRAVGVRRPGDPRGARVGDHPTVSTLDRVRLTAPAATENTTAPTEKAGNQ